MAWYYENSYDTVNPIANGKGTHIVGTKQANELGIYDMSGNVWEWCQDKYHNNYEGAPADGSAWDGGSTYHVIRGGRWCDNANDSRVARRRSNFPNDSSYGYGFRVVFDGVFTGLQLSNNNIITA